jgi:hypothetical protein
MAQFSANQIIAAIIDAKKAFLSNIGFFGADDGVPAMTSPPSWSWGFTPNGKVMKNTNHHATT